jgi:hypothetical protein
MTVTHTAQETGAWDEHFESLRKRYPKVKESILFSLHAMTMNPDIEIEALKALAKVHEIRVTRASLNAAKTLHARATTASAPKAKEPSDDTTDDEQPRARRPRVVEPTADTDALIPDPRVGRQARGAETRPRSTRCGRRCAARLGSSRRRVDPDPLSTHAARQPLARTTLSCSRR